MSGFVKLYGTILTSSVWMESKDVRLLWITMLAMCDARGLVDASVPGLAHTANISRDECEAALRVLIEPDPYSKNAANEGRRIERVDRGWKILNYAEYRERRGYGDNDDCYVYYAVDAGAVKIGTSKNPWARATELRTARPGLIIAAVEKGGRELEAARHAQFRADASAGEWFTLSEDISEHIATLQHDPIPAKPAFRPRNERVNGLGQPVAATMNYVALPEEEAEEEAKKETTNTPFEYPAEFELLWNAYPRKVGSNKKQTYRLYQGHLRAGIDFDTMHSGALRYTAYATAKGWTGTEFIKAAQVFFGRDQHFLLEWESSDIAPNKALMTKAQRDAEHFKKRGYI